MLLCLLLSFALTGKISALDFSGECIFYQFHIKIKVWKYINLIDQNCITYFKHQWIFQRFVATFRNRKNHYIFDAPVSNSAGQTRFPTFSRIARSTSSMPRPSIPLFCHFCIQMHMPPHAPELLLPRFRQLKCIHIWINIRLHDPDTKVTFKVAIVLFQSCRLFLIQVTTSDSSERHLFLSVWSEADLPVSSLSANTLSLISRTLLFPICFIPFHQYFYHFFFCLFISQFILIQNIWLHKQYTVPFTIAITTGMETSRIKALFHAFSRYFSACSHPLFTDLIRCRYGFDTFPQVRRSDLSPML